MFFLLCVHFRSGGSEDETRVLQATDQTVASVAQDLVEEAVHLDLAQVPASFQKSWLRWFVFYMRRRIQRSTGDFSN